MEQCSSEVTARYKASLVKGDSFADLTAGLGVDFSFIARNFNQADYVERQEVLCELAQHNFPLLGLNHVRIHQADGTEFLKTMKPVDCLFLDPARRDSNGGKTVLIADCEPDVCALEDLLVERAHTVMIKLSPMLDMASALNELKYVSEIHIVAVNNECKELIIILDKGGSEGNSIDNEVVISCKQVVNNFVHQHLDFTISEEKKAVCTLAEKVESYLYEPGAALLKAGAYRILSERYGVKKLHANSHLYTSDVEVDFPGRCFRVLAVSGFGKKELKSFLQGVEKANLTVRNFPSTVAELRKKLKLKEGGDVYLFATTLANGDKVLIKCEKLNSEKNIS
jgi:16S rRNA G966 N2-methylase RsmD